MQETKKPTWWKYADRLREPGTDRRVGHQRVRSEVKRPKENGPDRRNGGRAA